jgi:hypothetical protein
VDSRADAGQGNESPPRAFSCCDCTLETRRQPSDSTGRTGFHRSSLGAAISGIQQGLEPPAATAARCGCWAWPAHRAIDAACRRRSAAADCLWQRCHPADGAGHVASAGVCHPRGLGRGALEHCPADAHGKFVAVLGGGRVGDIALGLGCRSAEIFRSGRSSALHSAYPSRPRCFLAWRPHCSFLTSGSTSC